MNKNSLLILLTLTFFSCNKVKKIEKKMAGEWNIIDYTYQNNYGLSYKFESSGTFTFDSCNDDFCRYNLSLKYINNGVLKLKNDRGLYQLQDDAEHYTFLRNNLDGSISKFQNGRVILVNKDQLKTLFQDEFGIHHFILVK